MVLVPNKHNKLSYKTQMYPKQASNPVDISFNSEIKDKIIMTGNCLSI